MVTDQSRSASQYIKVM